MKTIHTIALTTLLSTITLLPACEGQTQGGGLTPTPGVTVPCEDAVLHSRQAYSQCASGLVTQMEEDSWCCPDGTTPTTTSTLNVTEVPCDEGAGSNGGGTVAAGDAGTDAPVSCTVTGFSDPAPVEGGFMRQDAIASPTTCFVTLTPGSTPAGSKCSTPSNGTNDAVVNCSNLPATGSLSYNWSCTCPNGSPAAAKGTTSTSW
jgi:hypothetical protein